MSANTGPSPRRRPAAPKRRQTVNRVTGEKTEQVYLAAWVDVSQFDRLVEHCEREGDSRSDAVRRALEAFLPAKEAIPAA